MKKIYLFFVITLFYSSFIFSQKETNNWIFGFAEWVNFNTEPPTTEPNPNFNFFGESNTVSMSDAEGNLLFYSDGFQVFNRNHENMPNGNSLLGNNISTNPVFAIPKPLSSTGYYLITADKLMPGNGLRWSELDMSLDGGLGDVTANQNILLSPNTTGKITAVLHSNLKDIWVIHHLWDSNTFQAWLVTENGFSATPVESHVGNVISVNAFSVEGQMKASPSGNKIGVVNTAINNVEIFNFDRTTGNLFNPVSITAFLQPYGLEFSQKEQYFYVTQSEGIFSTGLMQFDLNALNIQASGLPIAQPFSQGGGLQLASNGKIYHAKMFDIFMGVINNPDEPAMNAEYDEFGVELLFGEVFQGLPSFFHAYFQKPFFTYSGFCPGSMTNFEITDFDQPIDSVFWDFGDAATGADNFSNDMNPSHLFSGTGAYEVVLTVYSGSQTYFNTGIIHIAPTSLSLGSDQTICDNIIYTLNAYTPNATYLWSTGATAPSIATVTPGTFSVEVFIENCGVLTDEITINHIPAPSVDLGDDRGLCNGAAEVLDATYPNSTYLWSTGSTTAGITVFFGGDYGVTLTTPNGCTDSDMVNFQFDQVAVNPNQANLDCEGDEDGVAVVFPTLGVLPFTYLWSDGDTLYTNNHLAAGTYTVTVTDALGCTITQDFEILEPSPWSFNIVVQDDDPATSNPDGAVFLNPSGGTAPYTFDWDVFGEVDDPKFDVPGGKYNITVTDDHGCEEIIEVIVEPYVPTFVDEILLLKNTEVFPNPTNDFLFIKFPKVNHDDWKVSIFNTLGQQVQDFYFENNNNEMVKADVSNLESGIYFMKIKIKEEDRVWKLNVVH